jgi:hypothetical protein
MAVHLARNGHEVVLWTRDAARAVRMQEARENEKYLPSICFPERLEVTAGEVGGCEILAGAVPTQHMRAVFERLGDQLPLAPFVSLTLPTQIYRQEVGDDRPTAVLTGPCIGHEVASGLPTAVVIAGDEANMLQEAFRSDRFRVYTSTDRVGAELSAALKNVLAIAAGIVDGMQLGDNIKAALLTRGDIHRPRRIRRPLHHLRQPTQPQPQCRGAHRAGREARRHPRVDGQRGRGRAHHARGPHAGRRVGRRDADHGRARRHPLQGHRHRGRPRLADAPRRAIRVSYLPRTANVRYGAGDKNH